MTSETIPFLYCGNITAARALFDDYPVNTDDKPLIEYLAPRLFRKSAHETVIWCVGPKFAVIVDRILAISPPDTDPMLQRRSPANRRLARAGAAFHCATLWEFLGDEEARQAEWRTFARHWNASVEGDLNR